MIKPRSAIIAVTLFCLTIPILLQALPTAGSIVAPRSNMQIRKMDNGIQVMLLHIPSSPMVSMNVQIKAGSSQENFRTSGMTHMLEHLLFNGTTSRTQKELYAQADRIGAYNNANTTRFFTNFMMLVPNNSITTGMDIQADMVFNSTLPPEKFEKERGIVIEEIVQGLDDPDRDAESAWNDFLYHESSFELPTLGTLSTIKNMSRDQVYEFYKTWYVPNNVLLSVVGGFDPDTIWDQLEEYYGNAIPGELPVRHFKPMTFHPGRTSTRIHSEEQVKVKMVWPAPDMSDPDYNTAQILAWRINDTKSGLLPARIFANGLPPLKDISFFHNGSPGFGTFELHVTLPDDLDPAVAINGLNEVVSSLSTNIFDSESIDLKILSERSAMALLLEKPHYLGMMLAEPFVFQGFEWVMNQDRVLAQIEPTDLQVVAENWLNNREPMAMIFFPEENIAAKVNSETKIVTRQFSKGKPTLIIDQASPSQIFAIQAIVKGRSIWEGEEFGGGIDLLHHLMQEGAGSSSAAEIQQRLSKMGAKLMLYDNAMLPYDDHYTTSSYSFIRLEVLGEFWQEASSIVSQMLYETHINEEAIDRARTKMLRNLQRDEVSSKQSSRILLNDRIKANHPSAISPSGSKKSLQDLNSTNLKLIHELVFRPENTIISMVGQIPAVDLIEFWDMQTPEKKVSDEALNFLKINNPWIDKFDLEADILAAPRFDLDVTKNDELIKGHLGGEMASIRFGSLFISEPSDATALRLLFSIISDKMSFDLREKQGLAYSMGCWAGSSGGLTSAGAYMGTRPENLKKALPAMEDYLRNFNAKKITQDELDDIRGSIMGRSLMRRLASINQAWYRALAELSGNNESADKMVNDLQAVSLADLKRVANNYLDDINWITVVVD
jgi:zinc protease